MVVAALLVGLSAPLVVPLVALVDLVRPLKAPWSRLRAWGVLVVVLVAELWGLASVPGVLLQRGPARATATYLLQWRWGGWILRTASRVQGAGFHLEGTELLRPGPILLLVRHASVVDTLLPPTFVSAPTGLRLRYVVKKELRWDPCLDLVGSLVPNVFVDRSSREPARELAKVAELGRDLGPSDGVVIFPEGTRRTAKKAARALARLAEDPTFRAHPDLLERVASLKHLLPPRLGGTLALLDAAVGVDVVLCAHVGLEGVRTLADLADGSLVGTTVRVRFWRVEGSQVPRERVERVRWLLDRWGELDRWVDEHVAPAYRGDHPTEGTPALAGGGLDPT